MALPILYTLSLLLHGLVAWRLLPALDPAWAAGLAPVLLASALLLPMGLLAHRVARGALADRLAWVGLLCMGLFSSLLVLTALRDVLLAAVWVAATLGWSPAQALLPGLRAGSALVVPLVALLVTVLGFWNARRTARVVRVDVPVAALPAALEGFTVAQITDIHVGPTIKQHYLQAIVRKVNALEADMVAITGDLVDGKVHELADHVAPLPSCARAMAASSSPATTSTTRAPTPGWPSCTAWACGC